MATEIEKPGKYSPGVGFTTVLLHVPPLSQVKDLGRSLQNYLPPALVWFWNNVSIVNIYTFTKL